MEELTLKIPLVSVTVEDSTEASSKKLSYYVDSTCILSMDLFQGFDSLTKEDGSLDNMALVSLMVTPHKHLACIEKLLLILSKAERDHLPVSDPELSEAIQEGLSLVGGNPSS